MPFRTVSTAESSTVFGANVSSNRPYVLEGGDVIIRTSEQASGIFLVHRRLLCKRSSYFEALFFHQDGPKSSKKITAHKGKTEFEVGLTVLDLYFDHELKLGLLTPTKSCLNREPPSLPASAVDFSNIESFGLGRTQSGFICGPAPQFLWNEPQKDWYPTFKRRSEKHLYKWQCDRLTYEGYLSKRQMKIIAENENRGTLRKVSRHSEVVKHARTIWMALIDILYGRPLKFSPCSSCGDVIQLINDLWKYAQHTGLKKRARESIGRALMSIPKIHNRVQGHPLLFFHLAWDLSLPRLYLDAARHIIGRHAATYDGTVSMCALGDKPGLTLATDMRLLLMAGMTVFQHELNVLRSTIANELYLYKREFSEEEDDVQPYMLHAAVILENFCEEITTAYRSGRTMSSTDQASNPLHGFLELRRHICRIGNDDYLDHALGIGQRAMECGIDANRLTLHADVLLERFATKMRASLLFMHEFEGCKITRKWSRDWNEEPVTVHGPTCDECNRAEAPSKNYLTWLDPDRLFAGMKERPWPLNENLSKPDVAKVARPVSVKRASYAWLCQIGLSKRFEHLNEDR